MHYCFKCGILSAECRFYCFTHLLIGFKIFVRHTLSRNFKDNWAINYSLLGTDSWPARNKGFNESHGDYNGVDDDDCMITMTTSKTMLGTYGLLIILKA
jgi:hypothetical protein